jgi:lipid-binding SYLF domain-containing protein
MRRWFTLLLFIFVSIFAGLSPATTTSASAPTSDEDELLRTATLVFTRAVATPAAAIPAGVLMQAAAIAVVPSALKDGRRYYGQGVVSARRARVDYWTPPAVIAFEGDIPLDLESRAVDFVVIAQTRRGLDYLIQGRIAGIEPSSMAAGALGHNALVRIDADLLAYIQFDNYFAGVTIDNWVVDDMTTSNAALYGRPYSTDDIVRGAGFFHVPSSARTWRDALAGYFREMS